MSKIFQDETKLVADIYTNIVKTEFSYKALAIGTFGLGIFSFIVNLVGEKLRFFMSNTAVKGSIQLSYFLNLQVVVSMFFYFYARICDKKIQKIRCLAISGVSLFLIFCNMARGPLLFWATGVLIFEACRYVKSTNKKYLTVKQMMVLIILVVIFIYVFGAIGDFRTVSIYKGGASAHYSTPDNWPSGFTWIYVYLTSPLENMRYILDNENVGRYAFFNLLLYPVIKVGANLIGMGTEYVNFIQGFSDVYPYLKPKYGLNVSTFMADAYADLNYLGILVYIICYDIVAYITHRILVSKKIKTMSKALIFPIIIQVAIWSIFSNSVLRIAIVWVDIFFVLLWDKISHYKLRLK